MTAITSCRALHPINPNLVAALALLMHDGLQTAKLLVVKLFIVAMNAMKGFAARLGYYLMVRKRLIF
jgi:hypothetical protein